MSSANTSPPCREGILKTILLRLGAWITSPPILVGLNIFLMAGFLAGLLFLRKPETGQASAIILPTSSLSFASQNHTATLNSSPTATPIPSAVPTELHIAAPTVTPSPTPTLPSSASVTGINGHKQSMPLSCEARSAVDWAAYFGEEIDEDKFYAGLPADDNPDEGFVGDVQGSWGQIPPDDYGVHAKPIAQRLREYGLKAKHLRYMTLEELKREISEGRPVIVWVVGHVNRGTPVPYTTSSGEVTTVAKFEHTVIVTEYTEHKITVVDGARVYSIYQGVFMDSWDVLENQAVIWID